MIELRTWRLHIFFTYPHLGLTWIDHILPATRRLNFINNNDHSIFNGNAWMSSEKTQELKQAEFGWEPIEVKIPHSKIRDLL